jgi:hypothetical protein
MFECRACAAKSEEIKHLLAELNQRAKEAELLQKRLIELAEPGVNRRLIPPRPHEEKPEFLGPAVPGGMNFPGYERPPAKPGYEVE